ncbi:MFS transporter [Kitasatospora sp. NPDC052896]|uniref:MFS transporter n=1 Tax=Kitasatospora sp. NPDC052896 TaxID=3364061 RepID=UPI0037C8D62D
MPRPTIETSYHRRWLVLAVLCLSVLLTVVSNMALNVALPSLGRQLHAGASSLAWIVDAYVLCFAGLLLPAGAIGDRFGRKGALQCGLVVYGAAAVLGAFSASAGELIAARAVMGVGAALVMPGTLSILATVFPPAERAKAIAVWASVAGASVALSITWSGLMLEHFWWGSLFLGMAAVAVTALVAGWFLLPTSRGQNATGLDPVGAALSVVGVTGLLYGFIQAPDDGWTTPSILAAFAIGISGLIAFVVWERRRPNPMLDVAFFAERRMSMGSLSIAAAYFALFGMYFVLTQYLQVVRGYSTVTAGLYALPAGLAQFAVAHLAKPLVARHGLRPVLASGLAASAAGLLALASAGTTSPIWTVEAGLGLLGVGIGLTMPPATGAIMSSLPPHKAGVGSAVNDLTRELGGAFGIGVLGSLTLTHYRSLLAPVLTHQPAEVAARARAGLDGAFATPDSALAAARHAYASGLDQAMIAGALVVAATAVIVLSTLPGGATSPSRRADQPRAEPVHSP